MCARVHIFMHEVISATVWSEPVSPLCSRLRSLPQDRCAHTHSHRHTNTYTQALSNDVSVPGRQTPSVSAGESKLHPNTQAGVSTAFLVSCFFTVLFCSVSGIIILIKVNSLVLKVWLYCCDCDWGHFAKILENLENISRESWPHSFVLHWMWSCVRIVIVKRFWLKPTSLMATLQFMILINNPPDNYWCYFSIVAKTEQCCFYGDQHLI